MLSKNLWIFALNARTDSQEAAVVADIFSVERADRAMQDMMSRVNIEPSVTSVRWEKLPGSAEG
jgi:hypothetical protein